MKKLHPKAKWIFRLKGYLLAFVLMFFLSTFILMFSPFSFVFLEVAFLGGFFRLTPLLLIVIVFLGEIYAKLAYENYAYELNDKGILIKSGIVFKREVFIPYNKIQNFEIFQGIIARIFGFYQVFIETAGYSIVTQSNINSAEGKIPGVSRQEAEEIRERILAMENKNKAE